ncbi:MAG: CPBP family intramembrane glutamic endopeptidase [Marinicella sp.]
MPIDGVYPTLWIFSSAILLLLLLTKTFQAKPAIILSLNHCELKWFFLSLLLACLYWLADYHLMRFFSPESYSETLTRWQQGVRGYYYWSVMLSSVILAPLFEELYFRGLLLKTLKQKTPDCLAVISSAFLFACVHWSWPEFISLFGIGFIYGWMTLKANSIFPALLAHIIHNALTFWFYVSY